MPGKRMDIKWPFAGVGRRGIPRSTPDSRDPWPSPWAVNVRVDDPFDRRLRGGSRPGLTKFVADDMGTTISDLVSIDVSRTTGASSIVLLIVDSTLKTVEGGTTTTPVAYLTDESNDILIDASSNRITVSSGTAPASGFLVVGHQHVFAVTSSAITKFDPKTGQTDDLVASAGTIPTSMSFGAVYRDRLCLSGHDNAIYMSKQGDYANWDFGAAVDPVNPNPGRAVAFQLSLASEVGAAPTAMIPHKDAYLLCGSARTLWVVQGDPAAGGSLRRISENVGIIGSRAWTKVEDLICFLAEDGIYRVNGDGSDLSPLSEQAAPAELRDVDTSTTTVTMGYEHDRKAVHIFLRTAGGSDTHWIYELASGAFWPVRLQDDHSPLAVTSHAGDLLLAGGDGYIRKIGGDDDDGTNIESHVAIGPMRPGQAEYFGRIIHMNGSLAAGGGAVTWRIVTGDTAEEAVDNVKLAIEAFQSGISYDAYVKGSGDWTAGRANRAYPRVRAMWCCLWLQSTAKWAFEGATLETQRSGRWRGNS